jgi:hypothetical protein
MMKGEPMSSFRLLPIWVLGCFVVLASILSGCSSAQPTDDPGVERLGRFILMNKGPEAEVAIGYRHAENNLGSEWLLLEVAITSPPRQVAEIERKNVSVRTPAGVTVPLATQQEFNEAYRSLQPFVKQADVVRDPMDYWPPRKQQCAIQFFVAPGEGVAFDRVSVNDFRACEGRFFFKIPGGVQVGRYVLTIDLQESEIRIPFTLED